MLRFTAEARTSSPCELNCSIFIHRYKFKAGITIFCHETLRNIF